MDLRGDMHIRSWSWTFERERTRSKTRYGLPFPLNLRIYTERLIKNMAAPRQAAPAGCRGLVGSRTLARMFTARLLFLAVSQIGPPITFGTRVFNPAGRDFSPPQKAPNSTTGGN